MRRLMRYVRSRKLAGRTEAEKLPNLGVLHGKPEISTGRLTLKGHRAYMPGLGIVLSAWRLNASAVSVSGTSNGKAGDGNAFDA